MSYGSMQSRYFREYCDKHLKREDILSKLNMSQLKLMRNYCKWISCVKYKNIRATSNIGDKFVFCGIVNNLFSKDIVCESGIEQVGCEVKDSSGNTRVISISELDSIGVSSSESKVIHNIIEEIVSELEYLCYIKDTNSSDEYESKNYDKIRYVLDKLYDGSRGNSENELYYCYNILMAKLPLTVSMVNYYKEELYDSYKEALVKDMAEEIMQEYGCTQEFMDSVRKSTVYLMQIINSYLKSEIDLDKKKAVLKLGVKFESVYQKLSNGGKTDFIRLVEASKQTALYITTALGERLATKSEKKSIVSGVYKKDTYFLDKEKRDMLLLFGWCVSGDDKYYNVSGVERYKEDYDKIEKNYKDIWKALVWLGSNEFMEQDLKELCKGLKPVAYPDKAEDEVKEGSLVDVLKYIKENANEDNNYERIALDIAQKSIKFKNYAISEKQLFVVKSVYEKLTGVKQKNESVAEELKDGRPNLYNNELVDKLREIIKHPLFDKKSFTAQIMDSIVRYKKCSDKQYNIIEEEYSRLRLGDADPYKVFGMGSQSIAASESSESTKEKTKTNVNSFFIDDEDDDEETVYNKEQDNKIDLGSLTNISDLLGFGGTTKGV